MAKLTETTQVTEVITSQSWITPEAQNKIIDGAVNVAAALAIFIIGKWIVGLLAKMGKKAINKTQKDETLGHFVFNIIKFIGIVFVVVGALTKLGVPTASLVAAVGAIGLAIGFALQGSLANFASGILIIVFRPFKTGDLIDAGGSLGTVREIDLFTTKIITPENKTVIIPNAKLTSDNIINITETKDIRVDMTFGTSYSADIDHVKKVIQSVIDADDRILSEPAPFIGIIEHGDSSVNYVVRPWAHTDDYWGVFYDTNEAIKKAFDKENIEIPFPQRDLHIVSDVRK